MDSIYALGIEMETHLWTIWKKPKNYVKGMALEKIMEFTDKEMDNIIKAILLIKEAKNA